MCIRDSPDIASDPAVTQRLRKELQLTRHITHPNVCRVNELWEETAGDGQDVVFFTMELLTGGTLARSLKSAGPLRPADALPIIRQAAQGLAEAHRLGIVHRDLKPGNIFLTAVSLVLELSG